MKKQPFKKVPPEESKQRNITDRKVVRGESDFSILADGIMRLGDERHQQEEEFMKKLGEPDLFVPFQDIEKGDLSGMGYWRVEGGVIAYRRWPKGKYDFHSRQEYEDNFIQQLYTLLTRPARK